MADNSIKLSPEERRNLADKLDEDLDRFMDELAANRGSNKAREKPFDFDEWCREIDQHPAFLTDLKPGPDGQFSAEVEAIRALKYDDDEPASCAIAHKEEGNRYFGQEKYRWAIEAYTKGIKLNCPDRELISVLYANRAAANKRLGNLRSATMDCMVARQYWPDNIKAILRGAECLLELGRATKCLHWIDESNQQMNSTLDEQQQRKLLELKEKTKKLIVLEERNARRERAKTSIEGKKKQRLLETLKQRKIRIWPPIQDVDDLIRLEVPMGQLKEITSVHLSDVEDCEQLIWPLLLQYPEHGQTDFVEKCPEHSPLDQVLADVFDSPAEWDHEHEFRFNNIRLFVSLDRPDGQEMVREIFPSTDCLAQILAWPDVVVNSGLPVIQIYTRDHIQARLKTVDKLKNTIYRIC